jgi:hypothetical protein
MIHLLLAGAGRTPRGLIGVGDVPHACLHRNARTAPVKGRALRLAGVCELSFPRGSSRAPADRPAREDLWEINMKTKLALVAVACAALLVSACGSSPEDLIVGKWEAGTGGAKVTAEFSKDAKAKLTVFGQTVQGSYRLNGDELEWTLNGKTAKIKIKVTASELELTSDGKTIKYKKV